MSVYFPGTIKTSKMHGSDIFYDVGSIDVEYGFFSVCFLVAFELLLCGILILAQYVPDLPVFLILSYSLQRRRKYIANTICLTAVDIPFWTPRQAIISLTLS